MNFEIFNVLCANAEYDEVRVIGKDVEKEGRFYYILGMTLKEKKASLHILEITDELLEEYHHKVTPRESLKNHIESRKNRSFFMHTRELRNGKTSYETAGGTSGPLRHDNMYEAFLLFSKMREAGWKVSKDSYFYDVEWECLAVTNIELRDEFESLPEWTDDMQVLIDIMPEESVIELPVVLERGKTSELEFKMKDGSPAVCYINKVDTIDVWADTEEKFADTEYRERMLQHMTEDELEDMKRDFLKALEQQCPRGKHYMVIEYECTQEVGLTFYDREYLDTLPKPSKGSATSVFMNVKPEAETGAHGLKLRGCVIQKPLDKDEKTLEAELFSYSKKVEKRWERV